MNFTFQSLHIHTKYKMFFLTRRWVLIQLKRLKPWTTVQHYRNRRDRQIIATVLAATLVISVLYLLHDPNGVDWLPQDGPWPDTVFRYPNTTLSSIAAVGSKPVVFLAIVACGTRLEEAITLLKSAVIFSQHANLHIVGVSDKKNQPIFAGMVDQLRADAWNSLGVQLSYEIYPTWFPEEDHKLWRSMFLPCSAQRLFFPSMFPHIDSVMYIDSDALFLTNILNLWNYFQSMNKIQLAAMAPEDEPDSNGWYNVKAKIPFWEPRGLNAGIMLMNLTRMRDIHLEERALAILKSYYYTIKWADQDILNIMFHFNPEYMLEISCAFNFRAQHCNCIYNPSGDCSCHAVRETGAAILHGNRKLFHKFDHGSSEFLRLFYSAFRDYNLTYSSTKIKPNLKKFYHKLYALYEQNEPCQGASAQDVLQQFEYYLTSISE